MPSIRDFLLRTPGFAGGTPLDELQLGAIRRSLGGMATGPISNNPASTVAADAAFPDPETFLGRTGRFLSNVGDRVNSSLNSPLGRFSTSLLASSGPSLQPQSTLSNIGGALFNTAALGRQDAQDELSRRLIESQIGLAGARSVEALADASGSSTKATTDLGKILQDERAGILSPQEGEQLRNELTFETGRERQKATSELRAEFRKDTDGPRQSLTDLAKARSLLESDNPFAATAAFTSFIRSIDNSVVRPAEQAAYSNAAGLARRLTDELNKLQGRGPLGAESRRDLLESVNAIDGEMRGILDRTTDFYGQEAQKFSLDTESVTGIPSSQRVDPEITASAPDTFAIPSLPDTMSEDDVNTAFDQINQLLTELENRANANSGRN